MKKARYRKPRAQQDQLMILDLLGFRCGNWESCIMLLVAERRSGYQRLM